MSECDFKEIGVASFGQRRKLSLAIKDLQNKVHEPPESPVNIEVDPQPSSDPPAQHDPSQSSFASHQRRGLLSNPTDFDIERILLGSENGKQVLTAVSSGKLPNPERKMLVRLCVAFLVEKIGHMYPTSLQKEALAKAIVQQFPGARDTTDGAEGHEHYYANGHGFIEYRLKTIRVGQPNVKKTTKRTAPSPDLHADHIEEGLAGADALEKVEWMKHQAPRRETTTTIHSYFRDTHKYRQQLLRGGTSVTKMLENFPRFRDMPELINIDYDLLWPEGSSNFILKWHHGYTSKIIKVALSQGNSACQSIIEKFQEGDVDLCALELVATLLPSTNYLRKGKSTAASRIGSLSSFIQIHPNGTDINQFVSDKGERQPFLLGLGMETSPSEFFLIVDHISIPVGNNVVQSFDRLFKFFFVFSVEYPPELFAFYNFFAKVVYRNKFPCGVFPQVRALSAQLKEANSSSEP
ncbi:hypothetical protein HOLleu_02745 [Holothuria leucospilota]|uniref:Uncharacterized protein n=1 Tax=Holothuria leucospilota TaxID=206669 RepID=A0A9Q1HJX9_HOLLE|nr:hypothetical protein HOLleu_02745 [Holothuria leucospilota]